MSLPHLGVFNKTLEKSNQWIQDLQKELDWDDAHKVYRALRVVLHALRDHLTLEETVHLGSQFPMLIRGLYYEGWKPSKLPVKERHEEQFLVRVAENFRNDAELKSFGELEEMVTSVFSVIARHVSVGEIRDIVQSLPHELRNLWM